MDDFLELGMEGIDKLADKHFHRVPDKALSSDTYKLDRFRHSPSQHPHKQPVRRRSSSADAQGDRDNNNSGSDNAPRRRGERDGTTGMANSSAYLQDGPFVQAPFGYGTAGAGRYSTEVPRHRPQYEPGGLAVAPHAGGGTYREDGVSADRYGRRGTFDDGYVVAAAGPRRPAAMRRRSSSYHGPRRWDAYGDERGGGGRRRRDSTSSDIERIDDRVKSETAGPFTTSKEGLIGGAVGAVLGGWAAHKAQEARGKDATARHGGGGRSGSRSVESTALTLLGAAVGGLAVNTAVDKWEDSRIETRHKQEKWEDKFGDPYERSGAGGGGSGRNGERGDRGVDDYRDSSRGSGAWKGGNGYRDGAYYR